MENAKANLMNFSQEELIAFFADMGEPSYRAIQAIQWIHQNGVTDFQQMTNFGKSLRDKLTAAAEIKPLEIAFEKKSHDGTHKWLFRLNDGNAIETVFIPEANRGTLCVSSQVGCALNCSFCATGKEGFNRNLTLAEIIGQVWMAVRRLSPLGPKKQAGVTNVVMMGMGEPLLNYPVVLKALQLMMDDRAYGLSKYRVTVSTAGVIPALKQLQQDSQASLAVSLHAPNDELRNQLVPLNRKYPLIELMDACRSYFPLGSKRKVTFEYVMLDGVNDSLLQARQLIKLLKNVPCKMNLIPFNPFSKSLYKTSPPETVIQFQNELTKGGIPTWVRKTRGDDIDAACGQLAGEITDRTGRHQRWEKTGRLIPIPVVSEPLEDSSV